MTTRLEADLDHIEQRLKWAEEESNEFNSSLRRKAEQHVLERRQKAMDNRAFEDGLGIPLRRRQGAPATYSVPEVRRKPPVPLPLPGASSQRTEPALDMENYDFILGVCSRMARVLELSPAAFAGIKKEDLRVHFLVQLNAQYESMATGETFNLSGKTDIIIKYKGKNLFIAECKYRDGPKSLSDAVDQLLDYTSWRDTKTAILLFNTRKNFSAVVNQVPGVLTNHRNFVRQDQSYRAESAFRFELHHNDDKNRHLLLTVLAFEVPTGEVREPSPP